MRNQEKLAKLRLDMTNLNNKKLENNGNDLSLNNDIEELSLEWRLLVNQKEFEDNVFKVIVIGNAYEELLLEHYKNSRVSKQIYTVCGFFTYYELENKNISPIPNFLDRKLYANIYNENSEILGQVYLYVEDGKIAVMEGFTFFEVWDDNYESLIIKNIN